MMAPSSTEPASLPQAWPLPASPRPITIIGAGSIVADAHLPAYRDLGFTVEAIVDPDLGRAKALADRWGIAQASATLAPHIDSWGRRLTQKAGRSGRPKRAQRKSGSSCTQGTPAGLPQGIPGMGEEMEGAMQHAPQPGRHSMAPGSGGTGPARQAPPLAPLWAGF